MSGAWAFVGIVFVLVVLAGYAGHNAQRAQDAQEELGRTEKALDIAEEANAALHTQVADLRRYIDKQNYHISNLMVENYELHNLVNQAHGRGFIPQQFKQGREN